MGESALTTDSDDSLLAPLPAGSRLRRQRRHHHYVRRRLRGRRGVSLRRVILILGFANLLADGFSMGASNYLARRSNVEVDAGNDRADGLRHGAATIIGFVIAGMVPLVAYLAPIADGMRLPAAVGLTAAALFGVGASRSLVTKRGFLRSGGEMLLVGSLASVAFGIGAFVAGLDS